MAAPIIVSKTVDPPIIHECEIATITILARDPSVSGEIHLRLEVSNGAGEVTPDTIVVRLAGGGPIVYALAQPQPGQGVIIPDPDRPGVFTYIAPCPTDPDHNPATHGTLPVPHTH